MGTPVVTAVVTSYKREYAIVKRAIDSIVGQTYNNIEYNNIEILLIDDNRGEEGKTYSEALMALEKISPIIKIHHTKDRHGSQVARNLGISLAKGRYIAFLDDDDEWLPEKLAEQVIYMDSHPETGLCYCNGYIVYEGSDKNKRIPRFDGNFTSDTDYRGLLREDVIGSTSQALIRREVFDKVGLFDEALPARQDYEMWIRISRDFKVHGIDKYLFLHYISKGEEQISRNWDSCIKGHTILYNKYKTDIDADRAAKFNVIFYLAHYYNMKKAYPKAIGMYLRSFFTYPKGFFIKLKIRLTKGS